MPKATAKTTSPAPAATAPIQKQPQSKQAAAKQVGMNLYTDDKWALAYFNSSDLHFKERELLG